MSANVESMFYHGRKPWHRLGTELDHPATAEEALRAARLSWQVALRPVTAGDLPVSRYRAVVRLDRREALGIVGDRYEPIQNQEAFSFFDDLIGKGQAVYETAGSLDGGRRVWLLAKLPETVRITKEDGVGQYLLLSTSHDGRAPLRVLFTPIRVVCENTLLAAIGKGRNTGVSIRHSGDVREKSAEAERVLGLSKKYYDAWSQEAVRFVRRSLTPHDIAQYFRELVPNPEVGDPSRAQRARHTLLRLFEEGKGNALPTVRGTLWAAVNAVSEYVDHERPTRARSEAVRAEKRFGSALFGSGAGLKQRAWDRALALLS